MDKKNIETLEKIVDRQGDCLDSNICQHCPFMQKCLPTFLSRTTRATKTERFEFALDALTNIALLDEDTDGEYFNNRD